MDNQLPDQSTEMHPDLAFQVGVHQEKKQYDIHPSLQAELDGEPQEPHVAQEPTTEDELVESTESTEDAVVEATETQQESPKDRDWREVRARADEAKHLAREKEQLQREVEFYKNQRYVAPQAQEPVEDEYATDTEKRLQKEMHELRQQVANQAKETESAKRQAAVSRAEQRLAQDYPDIRDVVSDDNIKRLELDYPSLYNAVVSSSDVYSVGAAAYEMIVAKGIFKKPANTLSQLAQGNSNIAKNQSKPRSVSTVSTGESPIKKAANYMTNNTISSDEEAKQLYAEMISSSRGRI